MLHSVVGSAKRDQILCGVLTTVGELDDVMFLKPALCFTSIASLIYVSALTLIPNINLVFDSSHAVASSSLQLTMSFRRALERTLSFLNRAFFLAKLLHQLVQRFFGTDRAVVLLRHQIFGLFQERFPLLRNRKFKLKNIA